MKVSTKVWTHFEHFSKRENIEFSSQSSTRYSKFHVSSENTKNISKIITDTELCMASNLSQAASWIEVKINWKSEAISVETKRRKTKPAANNSKKFGSRKTIQFLLTFALFTGIQLEFMLDCSLKLPSNVSAISCLMFLLLWLCKFLFMIAKRKSNEEW